MVCSCGHKFLVPPPETDEVLPTAEPSRTPPPRANPRPAPARPRNVPASTGDSSGEVILVPQPRQPAPLAASPRWAEPIEPEEDEPLPEAEVVYPAALAAAPSAGADDLFGQHGAYGDPFAAGSVLKPLPPRSAPPPPPADRSRRERRTKHSARPVGVVILALLHFLTAAIFMAAALFASALVGLHRGSPTVVLIVCGLFALIPIGLGVGMMQGVKWVWWLEAFLYACSICGSALSIVLALLVPLIPGVNPLVGSLSGLLFLKYFVRLVIGSSLFAYLFKENVLAFFGLKRLDTGQSIGILFGLSITVNLLLLGVGFVLLRDRLIPQPPSQAAPSHLHSPRVNNEPPTSGDSITIWDARQRAGGVFSVEYRVDGGALNPSGSYFWIISGPAGKVEFPIPGTTWTKKRLQLSGRAQAAGGAELNGPLTCYIEEQLGGTRRRISNEVPVVR